MSATTRKFHVGVIQPDTQGDKIRNLEAIGAWIDQAAARGVSLVALPEMMSVMDSHQGESGQAEPIPGPTSEFLARKARQHGIWVHGGSFAEEIPGSTKAYNTTIMLNPKGEVAARYRKLHTFDVTLPDGTVSEESARIEPGSDIVTLETELGIFGFSICYDIRFPELFRLMALNGAQVIFTPANFTLPTGKDHWEPILRTRAIENGCYIIAPAQIGKKPKFAAYGNSMVIDPWGTVIARMPDRTGFMVAEIDLEYLDTIRARIPSLKNRRTRAYDLRAAAPRPIADRTNT